MHGGGARANGYASCCSPAKIGGASGYIISCSATANQISSLQRQRPFFADSSLMPVFAIEALQQLDWTSCSDQLADSNIPSRNPVRSKQALLKEQISSQRCCKCRAVIVRHAGILCMLMRLMLSVYHAWGNPTLTLRSARLNARTASALVLPLCAHE